MKYTITGDNLQFVNVQLEPGEEFQSVSGAMVYMSGNVNMESHMKGGLLSGIKRSLSGASMFLVDYKVNGGTGLIGLGGSAPGKIVDLDIGKGSWIVQKTGYLCSQGSVNVDMALQKKMGLHCSEEKDSSCRDSAEADTHSSQRAEISTSSTSNPERCTRSRPPTQ